MINKSILFLFAAAACFAQPPVGGPGAAPPVTELKTYLNLSDTQIASITASNRTAMEATRTIAEQMHTKHEALQALLISGSTDAAAIGRALIEIQLLRKQMETARTKTREQAVSFLTADQKNKLKNLDDAEKLRDEVREAHAFQLLAPPANGAEGLPGPGGPGPRRTGNFNQ